LDESTLSYAVATKSPDGKVAFDCVDNKAKAEAIVNAQMPVSSIKEKLDDK